MPDANISKLRFGQILRKAVTEALEETLQELGQDQGAPSPQPATTSRPQAHTAPSAARATVLRRGMKGPAVQQLQTELVKQGYMTREQMATGPGTFGPKTEGALKRFQARNGLSATGVFDAATRSALATPDAFEASRGTTPANLGAQAVQPAGSAGENALNIALSYRGRTANELKLANRDPVGRAMQDWVPGSRNCANFISGVLVAAGQISQDQASVSVRKLIQNLKDDPNWISVPMSQAQPGDVLAFKTRGGQHIELVAGRDELGLKLLGSNNVLADGSQAVSYGRYSGRPVIGLMRYVGP